MIVYLYLLAVFLGGPKKRKDLCSGWSLGMKFVNLSAIDEDSQNEIQSINPDVRYPIHEEIRSIFDLTVNDENYYPHILWAGDTNDYFIRSGLERLRRSEPDRFAAFQSLATILTRKSVQITNRENCIHLQKYGGSIEKKVVKISIGDDLENLLQQITSGIFMTERNFLNSWFRNREIDSYHFYEMSQNELDLDHSDKRLGKDPFDKTFKMIFNKKNDEWKYVLALCQRKTTNLICKSKN